MKSDIVNCMDGIKNQYKLGTIQSKKTLKTIIYHQSIRNKLYKNPVPGQLQLFYF